MLLLYLLTFPVFFEELFLGKSEIKIFFNQYTIKCKVYCVEYIN